MNIEVANRLVQYRKNSGLSQEQLAEKIGVSRQAISKWERSEASPDTDNLILLARLYNVSLDELLKTDDEVPVKSASVDLEKHESSQSGWEAPEEADRMPNADREPAAANAYHQPTQDEIRAARASDTAFVGGATADGTAGIPAGSFTKDTAPGAGSTNSTNSTSDSTGASGGFSKDFTDSRGNGVHFGKQGLHIQDKDDVVHIGKDGIHIKSKNGDCVDIGKNGVFVNGEEKKDFVHFDAKGVSAGSKNAASSFTTSSPEPEVKQSEKAEKASHCCDGGNKEMFKKTFPYPIFCVFAFLALGFLAHAWAWCWLIFLTIPLFYGLVDAVRKNNLHHFPYAVLVVIVYLVCGLFLKIWHPTWLLFLTIPLYHWIAAMCNPKNK